MSEAADSKLLFELFGISAWKDPNSKLSFRLLGMTDWKTAAQVSLAKVGFSGDGVGGSGNACSCPSRRACIWPATEVRGLSFPVALVSEECRGMSDRRRRGQGEREAVWSLDESRFRFGEAKDWDGAPSCMVVDRSMSVLWRCRYDTPGL